MGEEEEWNRKHAGEEAISLCDYWGNCVPILSFGLRKTMQNDLKNESITTLLSVELACGLTNLF